MDGERAAQLVLDRELAPLTQKWARVSLGTALPRASNREGKAKDMEAAKKMAKPMLQALDKEYANGCGAQLCA